MTDAENDFEFAKDVLGRINRVQLAIGDAQSRTRLEQIKRLAMFMNEQQVSALESVLNTQDADDDETKTMRENTIGGWFMALQRRANEMNEMTAQLRDTGFFGRK